MCERYTLPEQLAAEREFMPGRAWWKFSARFNVASSHFVPVIHLHEGQPEAVMMRWGLIPSWAEGEPVADQTIGVNVAELDQSPFYRTPWHEGQRCILPVAGFYAWRMTRSKYRQPYFIRLRDRSIFGFAALWDRSGGGDDVIDSCSIVHVPANELMTWVANTEQAMPAILRRRDYDTWLRGSPEQARTLLQPYPADWMQAYAVSPRVNSTECDDEQLIQPVHLTAANQGSQH